MSSETDNIVSPLANKRTAKSFNGSVKRAALSDISNAQTPTPKETVLPTTTPSLIKKEKKSGQANYCITHNKINT